jgi:hypothetical protein
MFDRSSRFIFKKASSTLIAVGEGMLKSVLDERMLG